MRLIDADRLKAKIMGWRVVTDDVFGMGRYHEREIILQAIEESPTFHAVPVVRGKWIKKPNPNWQAYSHEHCSICGWENGIQVKKYRGLNYCPDCGAKMSMK